MADFTSDTGSKTVQAVYLSTSAGDLVQIFPTSYNIKENCKLLGSPSEGGLMQYDNKVIQPRVVTFTGILKKPYFSSIPGLRRAVESTSLSRSLCKFYGKGGGVSNMVIESFEEIGDKNRFDAVEVKFVLKEYLEHNVNEE